MRMPQRQSAAQTSEPDRRMRSAAPAPGATFKTDEDRWRAVRNRDRGADDRFVFAVRTTGVYCRPSCGARRARRENVEFHATPRAAERAGFRACRRCRPNEPSWQAKHAQVIARACALMMQAAQPPDLASMARVAGLSPSHFHRLFKSITGITPKAYFVATRSHRVRRTLARGGRVSAAFEHAGFSSPASFYASADESLGMKPQQFRRNGEGMSIEFATGRCTLGWLLAAATARGICWIAMGDDPESLQHDFAHQFRRASLIEAPPAFQQMLSRIISFVEQTDRGFALPLDVQGTAFQHRVWRELQAIPRGETRTYAQIAQALRGERAAAATRAVAQACARNPVAVAIPCHRVVRADGSLAGYRWGAARKARLLELERDGRRSGAPSSEVQNDRLAIVA